MNEANGSGRLNAFDRTRRTASGVSSERPIGESRPGRLAGSARIADSSAAATRAYEEIKRRIVDLRYPPGAKLSEVQLAEELGYGRSPIRTAFARLGSEGWVTISPQSGTYVKLLSEAEIKEIYDFRLLLETHVSRLAAKNITADALDDLRREFRRRAPQQGDRFDKRMFDELNELDAIVHVAVYRAAGNSLITGVLLNLLEKVEWLKKASPSSPDRMKQWRSELGALLDAFERRDSETAAKRMREHIGHAADSGSEYRRLHPTPPQDASPRTPRGPEVRIARTHRSSSANRKASR